MKSIEEKKKYIGRGLFGFLDYEIKELEWYYKNRDGYHLKVLGITEDGDYLIGVINEKSNEYSEKLVPGNVRLVPI